MATFGELETIWRRRAFDDVGGGGSEDGWTSTDIYRAIAEAEEQWCRRTLSLSDYTSTFLHLAGDIGDMEFPLDSRILEIKRAKPDLSPILQLISLDRLDLIAPTWETDPPGTPRFYLTDLSARKLWVYPALAVADTIQLTVNRLPLTSTDTPLPTWTANSTLEILPGYHQDLLYWVTYRLYDYQVKQMLRPEAMWQEKSREAYAKFDEMISRFQEQAQRQEGYPRERRYGTTPDTTVKGGQ